MIAAVYGAVSLITIEFLGWFAFGLVQLRLSEALTVVALFTPAAIPGLWLGAVLANLGSLALGNPLGWLDVLFGGLGTLLAAWWTWHFRSRRALALAGPVICNALIVPAYLPVLLVGLGMYQLPILGWDLSSSWPLMYGFGVVSVGIGQAVVIYGLGWPLAAALERSGVTRRW